MGRVMAIDWGRRRVGVALSDETATLARPLPTLDGSSVKQLLDELSAIALREEARTIVVGLPANMDGSEGESAAAARKLGASLAQRLPGVSVVFLDERLSTKEARDILIERGERARKKSGRVDQVAAALLLQSYLDGRTSKP